MCNCKWTEIIIAIVIFITIVWPNILGATASMWVGAIGALVLLIHALLCKENTYKPMPTKAPAKKKKKKRR